MHLASAPHITLPGFFEKVGRKAEHGGGNRAALFLVSVEQSVWRTRQHRTEFPAEIVSVLHAGIEALPASRRMDMRRIPHQEHTPGPVAVGEKRVHAIGRTPADSTQR